MECCICHLFSKIMQHWSKFLNGSAKLLGIFHLWDIWNVGPLLWSSKVQTRSLQMFNLLMALIRLEQPWNSMSWKKWANQQEKLGLSDYFLWDPTNNVGYDTLGFQVINTCSNPKTFCLVLQACSYDHFAVWTINPTQEYLIPKQTKFSAPIVPWSTLLILLMATICMANGTQVLVIADRCKLERVGH